MDISRTFTFLRSSTISTSKKFCLSRKEIVSIIKLSSSNLRTDTELNCFLGTNNMSGLYHHSHLMVIMNENTDIETIMIMVKTWKIIKCLKSSLKTSVGNC